MATHAGSEGIVQIGSNTIAEVRSWTITENANMRDYTQLSDSWEKKKSAVKNWSGSLACWWDETDTNGQEAMSIGAEVTLNLKPEGNTGGDTYFTGTAQISSITRSVSDGNSTIEAEFNFEGDGALTKTTV